MKKRLFIATMVTFPYEELSFIKREISSFEIEGKWVEIENLHFTYKFLGDVLQPFIPEIGNKLEKHLSELCIRDIEIRGIGVFPDVRHARVLWAGVYGDLNDIKEVIDESLKPFGFKVEEREFKPHVTLMRIKKLRHKIKFSGFLSKMRDREFMRMELKQVALVESRLTSQGPVYNPVKVVHLK